MTDYNHATGNPVISYSMAGLPYRCLNKKYDLSANQTKNCQRTWIALLQNACT